MISITIDTSSAVKALTEIGRPDQIAFAVSNAINRVLNLIQDAVRGDMYSRLELRKVAWNLRQVKISKANRATASKLVGQVEINPEAYNLIRLNTGQDHLPLNGQKYVPIPNAEVFGKKVILKGNPLSISSLALHQGPKGLVGNQNTFVVDKPGQTALVLQRQAGIMGPHTKKEAKGVAKAQKGRSNKTGNRVLYTLVPSVRTPKKVDFFLLAKRVVEQSLRQCMTEAIQLSINTMKKR